MAPARVCVIHPPVSVARDFIDYPYFSNLGAVQLAAVLRPQHSLCLVDAYALSGSTLRWRQDGRAHLGAPVREVLEAVASDLAIHGPVDVVFVQYTPFHRPPGRCDVLGPLLARLQVLVGETPIVLADCYQSGQHYVEASGTDVLGAYPEANAWLKYEAEVSAPTMVDEVLAGRRPNGVMAGAAPDLDQLPAPAWDAIDIDQYFRFHRRVVEHLGRGAWAFPIDGRTLPVITSRGCPFQCLHCSSNPGRAQDAPKVQRRYGGDKLRTLLRDVAKVAAPTRLAVLDELINVNEAHWETFLDQVAALDLAFDVPNGMRADYLRPHHFTRMRGRVTTVSVSAESGSERVLREVVNKQLDLQHIVAAAENAHAAGVPLMIHFMIGLPGETAEEINETLALAMDLWDRFGARPAVQFATPLPGTQMAQGRAVPLVDDWGPCFQTAPRQPDAAVSSDALRRFKQTLDQRMEASSGPRKLIMNVTYVCNNHCTFCAVGTRTQLHGHPPRQRDHLDEYAALGVRMVDFDGGEPTLNPELLGLIRYARRLGFERINVTTNGRMCFYPDYATKLVRSGLTTLLFSVHGASAKIHAQQVGVAEAFEQTVGGIENCLAAAPPGVEIGMNITITKGNHDTLDQVAQLCWDLGLRWLNIQFLTPFGRATKFVAPDTQRAADLAMRVIDTWRDRMKLQVINLPYCFMPGYEEFMLGDLQKVARHMVFVNNEDVNLSAYLAERRRRRDVCAPCTHAILCGGFYELEKIPEPPWLIGVNELTRRIDRQS